jgi:hypothetical protein
MSETESKNVDNIKERLLKLKKRKVKAWCGECFQSFENGPFAKVCKEHVVKGKCNLVECKKKIFSSNGADCVRKFPNTNSENRHTYCISEIDIKNWEEQCKIQNCLGVKRKNSEINYNLTKCSHKDQENVSNGENEETCSNLQINSKLSKIKKMPRSPRHEEEKDEHDEVENEKNQNINKLKFSISCLDPPEKIHKSKSPKVDDPITNLTVDLNFENLIPNLNYKNYEFSNLIDEINNLNFWEGEKFSLDDKLIDEFNNIYFNTPEKVTQNETKKCDDKILNNLEDKKIINSSENKDLCEEKINIESNEKKEKCQLELEVKEINLDSTHEKKEEILEKLNTEIPIEINQNSTFKSNKVIIPDDEGIDSIFERVYIETKIPKSILNKLKNAFKKRGIFNGKILRLYYKKHQNLNFLVEDFKKICTQVEGVALYLESIL